MKRHFIYGIMIIGLLVIWQYFGSSSQTIRLLLSSPSLVFDYFLNNLSDMWLATKTTFVEACLGLLIATIFSFGIMILCFYKPKLMDFVLPIMITSQVIPLIVLAPFFIILFGFGLSSKIAMAAVISFFPIFVNFAHGYKNIDSNIHELMHINNASLKFKIYNVYFPLSMGSIMAGIKISSTLSIIGAIVAEFSGAESGLGKNLYISAIRLEPDLMMCSLILSIFIGLFFYSIPLIIEKKLIKWK
jgi:ABC-type nitrate/sulfonate/bicarbonate transport system permease component